MAKKIILLTFVLVVIGAVVAAIAQENVPAAGAGGGMRGGRGMRGRGMDTTGMNTPRGGRMGRGNVGFRTQPPLPKEDQEKSILAILDEMNRNQSGGMMNVPPEDGRILRILAESLGAKHVVELGTSNGYSGIWWCLALRKTEGKLTTYEINAQRAALARENFKKAGVEKLITLVEGDAHQEVTKLKEQIDILFLDADKDGYIDYLNKLLPLVRPGGLIVAHNINQSQADARYIEAITTNSALDTVFLNQQTSGISVTLKKR